MYQAPNFVKVSTKVKDVYAGYCNGMYIGEDVYSMTYEDCRERKIGTRSTIQSGVPDYQCWFGSQAPEVL